MCVMAREGVSVSQRMITAAVVVDGTVQVGEGNRSEHVCVVIEMIIGIAFHY